MGMSEEDEPDDTLIEGLTLTASFSLAVLTEPDGCAWPALALDHAI